jgi:winged helix DNA-binding protein
VLGQRALNRALLARQGLLERRALSIPEALEAMGGLQAQYAPSMYIGLWSRVRDLRRAAVTEALQDRTAVQGTLMRNTIHLVSRADYWPLAVAIRHARREQWLRATKRPELSAVAERLRHADWPLKRVELEALVGREDVRGIGLWIDLVRVPPSGTGERRRADLYAPAEDWLGPPGIEPDDALDHLVRRYLTGFGPATKADIASWAGMGLRAVEPALRRLDLVRDGDLYDLPEAPLPEPDTPAPVRLLPTWDATLLVHARRTLILPEEFRPRIFNAKLPQSVGTFLLDGQVAGAWRPDATIEPFRRLTGAERRAVEAEAARLAEFAA